ncbi:flavodoxin, partial [Salibacterium salarium]
MVFVLIAYATMGGNTEEVAEIIAETMAQHGIQTKLHRISDAGTIPNPAEYDAFFIGSFTWGRGSTPPITKRFIANLGYKPANTYVFGTGDTQFGGDDLFCRVADRMAEFYEATYQPLKIEQSPRG